MTGSGVWLHRHFDPTFTSGSSDGSGVEVYKVLPDLEVRRIGVQGGVAPWGQLIRIERGSVLRMCGEPIPRFEMLPRWVTLKQAG